VDSLPSASGSSTRSGLARVFEAQHDPASMASLIEPELLIEIDVDAVIPRIDLDTVAEEHDP